MVDSHSPCESSVRYGHEFLPNFTWNFTNHCHGCPASQPNYLSIFLSNNSSYSLRRSLPLTSPPSRQGISALAPCSAPSACLTLNHTASSQMQTSLAHKQFSRQPCPLQLQDSAWVPAPLLPSTSPANTGAGIQERLSHLLKITQLMRSEARAGRQAHWPPQTHVPALGLRNQKNTTKALPSKSSETGLADVLPSGC